MCVIVSINSTGGLTSTRNAIQVAAPETRYRGRPLVAMMGG